MRYLLTAILFILGLHLANSQNIIIANNNPGATTGVNIYPSLQQAIDSAVAGDIVHVIPSNVDYGTVSVGKQLQIVGVGFNPPKDGGPRSLVTEITLDSGSTGSSIIGLIIDQDINLGINGVAAVDNIIIENNRLGRVWQVDGNTNISNVIIRNNIIEGNGGTFDSRAIWTGANTSNIIITNNIIMSVCCTPNSISGIGLRFENNVFVYSGNSNTFGGITNCVFEKNIFLGTNVTLPVGNAAYTGNTFNNNLSFGASGGSSTAFTTTTDGNSGTGNIEDADPLFVDLPLTASWSDSYNASLQVGSPAILSPGDATQDIGVTGGAVPFDTTSTNLPLIQSLSVPSVVKQGDNLDVQIQASGN